MTRTLWCEWAWMPDGPVRGVRLALDDGLVSAVSTSPSPGPADVRVDGMVIPGAANGHSHALPVPARCRRAG